MGGSPTSGEEHRHHPRLPLETEVHYLSEDLTLAERTKDISLGGLFIISDELDAVGTTAEIKLRLPGGVQEYVCEAEICWTTLDWELHGELVPRPTGMGLRYTDGCKELRKALLRAYGSQLLHSEEIE